MEDWLSNSFPLCPVLVEEDCLIEDCDTLTLQVCRGHTVYVFVYVCVHFYRIWMHLKCCL